MKSGGPLSQPPVRYRFGPFELSPEAVELRRQGVRVPLVGQPLRILLILLQNPDRVVTREELRDALWPGDVHVAFDGALNTAVRKLRLSLEDSPSEERYIQTVPRAGYRFIAPVETIPDAPSLPEPIPIRGEPLIVPPPPRTTRRWPWIALGTFAVLALTAVALARWFRHPEPLALSERAFVTSFPGDQTGPAPSPDGGQIAFAWADPEHEKVSSLYLTSNAGLGLHRLTNSGFKDTAPAWSPDGGQIAFLRDTPDGITAVMVMPSSGGPERRIAETDARSVCWTPGGNAVVTALKRRGERNFDLWSVSVRTGERHRVSDPADQVDGWERFAYSPDGSLFAWAGWNGSKGTPELFVRPVAGGPARQVSWLNNRIHNWWCWMPDSRSLLVTTDEQGTRRLFRIRLDDPHVPPEPIEGVGDDILYPSAVAAGGKSRLVFCQQRLTSNLHHFQIVRDAHGNPIGLEGVRSIAPATRTTLNPVISRDRRRLVWVSDRSLFTEIWLSDADGANPHPLTSFSSAHTVPGSPQWSPDGTRIVFCANHNEVTDLYLAPADGGPIAQLTHQTFDVIRPSFSRDGKWIFFSKRDQAADPLRLWKIPARPDATERDAQPIAGTAPGIKGMEPIESQEGGIIYYVAPGTRELWSVPLAGGQPAKVIGSGIMLGWWTPAKGGVYYVDLTKTDMPDELAHPPIWFYDAADGTNRRIGELPARPNIQQPGISVLGDELWTDWIEFSTTNVIRGELH